MDSAPVAAAAVEVSVASFVAAFELLCLFATFEETLHPVVDPYCAAFAFPPASASEEWNWVASHLGHQGWSTKAASGPGIDAFPWEPFE